MKMAETHSPESHLNGGGVVGASVPVNSSENVGAKRQRRPSVRLGEIGGDHLYDSSHPWRSSSIKQWKHHLHQPQLSLDNKKDVNPSNKGSKTRAITNLTPAADETLVEDKEANFDAVAIGSGRVKDSKKRASIASTKRVRSNWISKDNGGGGDNNPDVEEKSGGGDDMDGKYCEFDMENSESPLREHSPIHSVENLGDGNERNEREMYYNRRPTRTRDHQNQHIEGNEESGPSDAEARDYGNCGGGNGGEDGVKIWLNSLGLGRYAPVFEIHEVDDEVLPMLTLEDLKDMGINAVGSRRKMFCAIQKLGKGFS